MAQDSRARAGQGVTTNPAMRAAPAAMTDEEYLLLNELIAAAIGISFPEHKREVLEARLRPRLQALRLPTYLDYYFTLQSGEEGERCRLAELVTNNETYFFREAQQFDALFEQALENLRPGEDRGAPGEQLLPMRLPPHCRHRSALAHQSALGSAQQKACNREDRDGQHRSKDRTAKIQQFCGEQ